MTAGGAEGRAVKGDSDIIVSRPECMGRARVFRGTRVPVEVVFESLVDGMTVEEILDE